MSQPVRRPAPAAGEAENIPLEGAVQVQSFVRMKTVGHRRIDGGTVGALQRTMAALRASGALVPRGVYRFSSFEEADAWMIRTMARTHASLRSKTSSGSATR